MKRKMFLIYLLLGISVGYLFYSYLFTDFGYGMMSHHYGYYDDYSNFSYLLNSSLVFLSYSTIIIIGFILLSKKTGKKNDALHILDNRLSRGEISIEEYAAIKRELKQ